MKLQNNGVPWEIWEALLESWDTRPGASPASLTAHTAELLDIIRRKQPLGILIQVTTHIWKKKSFELFRKKGGRGWLTPAVRHDGAYKQIIVAFFTSQWRIRILDWGYIGSGLWWSIYKSTSHRANRKLRITHSIDATVNKLLDDAINMPKNPNA